MAVIPPAPPPPVAVPPTTSGEQNAERRNVEIQSERPTEESFQSNPDREQDVVVVENPQRQSRQSAEEDVNNASTSSADGRGIRVDIRA